MSLAQTISLSLQRQVKPAGKFAGLFPHSSCSATKLGNGKNDTHEGVKMMADLINKYSWQTEKVAQKLKDRSLAKTCQNIYDFLYNYFQYQADEALQQLRSPACSWNDRLKGIDCKSYSILAGSICQNLGIAYAIRQVKQPGPYADLWTHVYVVVPKNQKGKLNKQLDKGEYYVLDGTKSDTNEVFFVQKEDRIMQSHQYVGMNAPSAQTAKKLKVNAEGERRLLELSRKLPTLGFHKNQINLIVEDIRSLLVSGVDPSKLYIFFLGNQLNVRYGQSRKVYKPVLVRENVTKMGLNAGEEEMIGKAIDGNSDLMEKIKKALKSIDFAGIFSGGGKFFSELLKGCSGSTFSPSKVEKMLTNDMPGLLNYSGINGSEADLTNINYFNWLAHGYWFNLKASGQRLGTCSRSNLNDGAVALGAFIKEVMRQVDEALLKQGVILTEIRSAKKDEFPSVEICQIAGNGKGWNNDCGKNKNYIFIGKTNPNNGKTPTKISEGGLEGTLKHIRKGDDEPFMSKSNTFYAPFFEANRDFTFDGGFLNNIDVDKLILDAKIGKGETNLKEITNSVSNILTGNKDPQAQINNLTNNPPKTTNAGMGWLFGIGLVALAVGTNMKNKKKKAIV